MVALTIFPHNDRKRAKHRDRLLPAQFESCGCGVQFIPTIETQPHDFLDQFAAIVDRYDIGFHCDSLEIVPAQVTIAPHASSSKSTAREGTSYSLV